MSTWQLQQRSSTEVVWRLNDSVTLALCHCRTGLLLLIPKCFLCFVCECMWRIYLSVPVNLMLFGSAEQTSAVIICLEKVTSQISKVITFWLKTDDLTCQYLSFVWLWESMTALLKPSVLASNVSQLYFFSPSLFLQASCFCSVKWAK